MSGKEVSGAGERMVTGDLGKGQDGWFQTIYYLRSVLCKSYMSFKVLLVPVFCSLSFSFCFIIVSASRILSLL